MRMFGGILAGCTVIALGLAGLSGVQAAREPFASARVATEGARVGYHLSADIRTRNTDIPNGCVYNLAHYSYEGELPPGITFHKWDPISGQNSIAPFTGTPRQPGTWRGVLEEGLQCQSGPDVNLYRRRIHVTFVVQP